MDLYVVYDTSTGQIAGVYTSQSYTLNSGQAVLSYLNDTAPSSVLAAQYFANRYLVQGNPPELVLQPYFTMSVTNTGNQYTVTATLNNPPSTPPSSVTFSVAGGTFDETLSNNQASCTFEIHPSFTTGSIPVTVSASGCVSATTFVGNQGNLPVAQIQIVTPPNGGVPIVGPASNVAVQWLQQYYAVNNTTIEALLTNTFTALNVLYDTVFNVILPALQQTSYTPVSLTTNQQNAVSEIKSNVLANLVTTLANGYPSGASAPQMQFGAFLQNWEKASQNMQAFMNDLQLFAG